MLRPGARSPRTATPATALRAAEQGSQQPSLAPLLNGVRKMNEWEDIQNRKYPPIGRCIYCASKGGPDGLRSEHIVPYSLGGHAELEEASCRSCEKITSYIDGYLSRNIFYELRSHAGAPSRRKLPSTLSAKVLVGDQEFIREFLAADQPYALMLPTWDLPGIMRQVQPSPDFPVYNLRAYSFIPKNFRETLGLADDAPDPMVQIPPGKINNITFARAIAKIAYCHAIAKYGLNGFRHLVLPDIILGKYPCVPHFVGSDPGRPPPRDPRDVRHVVGFTTATGRDGMRFLCAAVRLFAHSGSSETGMPIYRVVMGAPRET
jgi:HNH endonuclease